MKCAIRSRFWAINTHLLPNTWLFKSFVNTFAYQSFQFFKLTFFQTILSFSNFVIILSFSIWWVWKSDKHTFLDFTLIQANLVIVKLLPFFVKKFKSRLVLYYSTLSLIVKKIRFIDSAERYNGNLLTKPHFCLP